MFGPRRCFFGAREVAQHGPREKCQLAVGRQWAREAGRQTLVGPGDGLLEVRSGHGLAGAMRSTAERFGRVAAWGASALAHEVRQVERELEHQLDDAAEHATLHAGCLVDELLHAVFLDGVGVRAGSLEQFP